MQAQPQRPSAYLRLSEARKGTVGESLTISDQRKICAEYASRFGWGTPVEYVDDDISAAMTSNKPRPGFERMMTDLEAGKVDGILCRDLDRLYRSPMEQARLGTLATVLKVPIITDGSLLEVWTPSGYLQYHMLGGLGHFENLQKAKRQRAQALGAAQRGQLYLRQRPFGWVDSQMSAHNLLEAEAIRLGVHMLGEFGKYTLRDVADKWNEMGVRTPRSNKLWIASNVRTTLMRPAIAGIVTHKEEQLDVPAAFDAIVSKDDYERMLVSLKMNSKGGGKTKHTPIGKSPLRGVAKCGRCGDNLTRHNKTYRCVGYPNRCQGVYIKTETLEDYIFSYVASRIALMPSVAFEMDSSLAELRRLTEQLETLSVEREMLATSDVSMASKLALLTDLDARQAVLDKRVADLRSESALTGLVWELAPLGKDMNFKVHTANKKIVLDRLKGLSIIQQNTLVGTFGIFTVYPGKEKHRIRIKELDPFGGYIDAFPLI